jgi:septal ring factor EnvC (AmiA/AmiB activator)
MNANDKMDIAQIGSVLAVVTGLFSVASQLGRVLKAAYRLVAAVDKVENRLSSIDSKLLEVDKTFTRHHEDIVDLRIEMERLNMSIQRIEIVLIRSGHLPIDCAITDNK